MQFTCYNNFVKMLKLMKIPVCVCLNNKYIHKIFVQICNIIEGNSNC